MGPLKHPGHCSVSPHLWVYPLPPPLPHLGGDFGLWPHVRCLLTEGPQWVPSLPEPCLENGSNRACSGLPALFPGLSFDLTYYVLYLELGVKDMMTDKPGLLPELTCNFLSAVGCRGVRKALEAMWTEEMAFEVSPGRSLGISQSDKAGKVFLVEEVSHHANAQQHEISWPVQGFRSFSLASE